MFHILPSGSTVQQDDLHIPTLVVGIAPEGIREHGHVAQVPAFVVVVVGAASVDRARAVLGDVYTRCRRDGGEHVVQCLGHHRRYCASPDPPGDRIVDQAGRGHRPDVGLPADALGR